MLYDRTVGSNEIIIHSNSWTKMLQFIAVVPEDIGYELTTLTFLDKNFYRNVEKFSTFFLFST